jgi:aminobenzoyl-glutamate utilization protein B
MKKSVLCLLSPVLCLLSTAAPAHAQKTKPELIAQIDATRKTSEDIALKIWNYAEIGYKETQSSALLQSTLRAAGFTVQAGVADMPTAFVASYGSGSPVIGLLAEFDALPGVSQTADPEKKVRPEVNAGHACGHHLFGAASTHAAITLKNWLQATGQKGTLRLYGTPAEEGGSGKVYMVRAGLFNDVDAVMHWHAGDRNAVRLSSSLANISGKFRFRGAAAHAAASPERGRSALDGVEAMNHMVNLLREHVPDTTRIHYVITKGGEAPNVVPAFAESYYYVRSPNRQIVTEVWDRVTKAAQGAAMGTGTTVEWEITGGVYELLGNEALAAKIGKTLFGKAPAVETAALVMPFDPKSASSGGGSTDVSDVSWATPTVGLNAATWVPGTPSHSWQAVAAGGTTIGLKGMIVAAKTLALTGVDLFTQPELLKKAKAEFEQRRGPGFKYESMVGTRKPPLDYRD